MRRGDRVRASLRRAHDHVAERRWNAIKPAQFRVEKGYDTAFFPAPALLFLTACLPSSSLVSLTFFTFSVSTFSFFTFSFFTFSFLMAGPATACFARRLACLTAPCRSFLVFWRCRLAFSIDA